LKARPIAIGLIDQLSRPYVIRDLTIQVSASIGAAGYPEDGRSVEALLEAADTDVPRQGWWNAARLDLGCHAFVARS
jgi:predicted signal transduction protein with EAL and GGDEF domain